MPTLMSGDPPNSWITNPRVRLSRNGVRVSVRHFWGKSIVVALQLRWSLGLVEIGTNKTIPRGRNIYDHDSLSSGFRVCRKELHRMVDCWAREPNTFVSKGWSDVKIASIVVLERIGFGHTRQYSRAHTGIRIYYRYLSYRRLGHGSDRLLLEARPLMLSTKPCQPPTSETWLCNSQSSFLPAIATNSWRDCWTQSTASLVKSSYAIMQEALLANLWAAIPL